MTMIKAGLKGLIGPVSWQRDRKQYRDNVSLTQLYLTPYNAEYFGIDHGDRRRFFIIGNHPECLSVLLSVCLVVIEDAYATGRQLLWSRL